MAITRYSGRIVSPWQELDQLTRGISRLFDENLSGTGGTNGSSWVPAVNVEESADAIVITAELPGMRKEDVEIELENSVLTVRGEKREERREGDDDRRYHLWERRYGAFQRSFTLPRTVDAEAIQADFEDGVLQVRMPKAAEARGRKIQIGSGS